MWKPDLVLRSALPPEQALRQAGWVLNDIGKMTVFDKEQFLVKGEVSYWGKVALVDVKVVDKSGHSDILIEAVSPTLSTDACNSAVIRFRNAFENFDKPDYKPNRTGVSPRTVVWLIVGGIVVQVVRWIFHLG